MGGSVWMWESALEIDFGTGGEIEGRLAEAGCNGVGTSGVEVEVGIEGWTGRE